MVGRWPLSVGPGSETTGPLVQEDGSVVLLTSHLVSDTHELRRLVLRGRDADDRRGRDESALTPSQRANLRVSKFSRCPPGTAGCCCVPPTAHAASLVDPSHFREIYRVGPANVLSTPLTLVPQALIRDQVYHTDVVLGEEDAAWAHVEGYSANGFYAKTFSFDPVSLVIETQNALGSAAAERSDLRIRSALGSRGIYLSGPSTAFVVGGSSIANGFAAGGTLGLR